MELSIDNHRDKECEALTDLFNDITDEMKSGIPKFEELSSRAGKLQSSLKQTVFALSSFMDMFQKITEDACSTIGGTTEIGSCLQRILDKQRGLESRMKSIAGSLNDNLSIHLLDKSEEWKRNLNLLEKEHIKSNKKNKRLLKKKSEHVLRLRKKLKKDGYTNVSLRRLLDDALRDLNVHFVAHAKAERTSVQKALSENRRRFNTLLEYLKPILREELVNHGEVYSLESVIKEADQIGPLGGSLDSWIDQLIKHVLSQNDGEDHYSLHLPTPPSSPLSSISIKRSSLRHSSHHKSGMNPYEISRAHGNLYSMAKPEPRFHHRPSSTISLHEQQPYSGRRPLGPELNRPWSTAFWNFDHEYRRLSNAHSDSTERGNLPDPEEGEDDESTMIGGDTESQTYSTIKRSWNPIYRPSDAFVKSVPMPRRCASADRNLSALHLNRQIIPCLHSCDQAIADKKSSVPQYATPTLLEDCEIVPNFNSNGQDMIIPHPIYLNSSKESQPQQLYEVYSQPFNNQKESHDYCSESNNNNNGCKVWRGNSSPPIIEEGSSNSSDSLCGSSSGYGSQFAINKAQSRRDDRIKVQPLVSDNPKPIPPVRGSSISDKQSGEAKEDYTPQGSQINLIEVTPSKVVDQGTTVNKDGTPPSRRLTFDDENDHRSSKNRGDSSLFCAFKSK